MCVSLPSQRSRTGMPNAAAPCHPARPTATQNKSTSRCPAPPPAQPAPSSTHQQHHQKHHMRCRPCPGVIAVSQQKVAAGRRHSQHAPMSPSCHTVLGLPAALLAKCPPGRPWVRQGRRIAAGCCMQLLGDSGEVLQKWSAESRHQCDKCLARRLGKHSVPLHTACASGGSSNSMWASNQLQQRARIHTHQRHAA